MFVKLMLSYLVFFRIRFLIPCHLRHASHLTFPPPRMVSKTDCCYTVVYNNSVETLYTPLLRLKTCAFDYWCFWLRHFAKSFKVEISSVSQLLSWLKPCCSLHKMLNDLIYYALQNLTTNTRKRHWACILLCVPFVCPLLQRWKFVVHTCHGCANHSRAASCWFVS